MSATREIAPTGSGTLWIETDEIARAIAHDELSLEYVPTFRLRRGYPSRKVEARPVWAHPRWGILGEKDFRSQADRAGFATTLTEWVLSAALRQTREWRRLGVEVDVAVNLSARDLHLRLAGTLAAVIEFSGSTPGAITCEIPETVIAQRSDLAIEIMSELRWLGVRVAIDDFGRTLSSFGWLAAVPADEVKLAAGVLADIPLSSDGAARAVTAVAAAEALDVSVVACGADSEQELETARALGCDAAQGSAVSMPLDADAALSWLRARPDQPPYSRPG